MSHRPHPPRRSSATPSVASRNGNQVRVAGARRASDVSSASIVLSVSTVSSPPSSPLDVGSSSSQLPSQAQEQAMYQQQQYYQYQLQQQQQQQHRRHGSSSNVTPAAIRRHSANVMSSSMSPNSSAAPLSRSSIVSGRPRPTSRVFIGNAVPPSAEASDSIPRSAPSSSVSVRPSFSLRRRTSQRTLGTPRPRPAQPPSAPPPAPGPAKSSGRKTKAASTPGVNPLANCLAFLLCRTTTDRSSSTTADASVAPPIPLPAMYMPATTTARAASRISTMDPRRHSTAPSAMSALDTGVTATLLRDAGAAGAGESSTSHMRGHTMSDVGSSPEHSPEVIPDPDPVSRYNAGGDPSAATSPRSGASTPWSSVPAPRMPNRDTFSSALSSRSVDTDDEGGYLTTDEAMSEYDVDETEMSVTVEGSAMSFADESEVEPEPVLVRKSTPLLVSANAGGSEDPAASMSIQYRYRASSSSMSGAHSVGGRASISVPAEHQVTPSAKSSTTVPTSVASSYHVPAAPPPSTATQAAQYTAGPGATSISFRHRPTPPAPPPSASSHPPTSAQAPYTQADPGAYSITHRTAAGTDTRVTVSPAKERAAFGNKWAGAWHPGWRSTRAFVHSVFDLVGCNREAVARMYPLFRATRMTPQHFSVMTIYLARFLAAYRNTMPEASGTGLVEAPGSPASASDDSRRSLDTVQLTRTRGALGSFKWKLGQAKKKLTRTASKSKLRAGEGEEELDAAASTGVVAAATSGVVANQSLDEQFAAAWAALATERLPFDRPTSVPSARAAAKSTGRSNIPPAERLVRAQVRLLTVATLIACKVLNDHSFTAKAVSGVAPEKCFSGCPDLVALEMRVAVLLEFDFAVRRAHLRPLLEAVIMGAGSSRAMATQQQQQQMQGSLRSVGSSVNGGRPATFAEPSTAAETVEGAAEEAKATISVCRRLLRILDETMADLGEVDEIIDLAPPTQQPQNHHQQHQHVHYAMSPPALSTRVDTMDSGHASVSSPQHYQHAHGSSAATATTSRRRNADSAVASTAHSATSSRRATVRDTSDSGIFSPPTVSSPQSSHLP
ncbi:hypothetical protein BCR44DRAFT_1011265 [Catenaria anguillulae PL171]|uniref:Uncharacterized protein n=1 Tax=Catenaria anguillulae PL171 TaxID=765915 RepID=A0A1Y2I455_9FUNG|nr:hypothetical protein BCR44DRAFT_1011265 [Catenaria anguillulae PL171]